MADKASEQSIMDKSMRSVFVGNIPYEATEEKLKEIFSEVGPVLSLKLVFDRESGKPKGFGFCEYKDQETALSAMRNLNGYEIGGRTLRVDNACTEKSRMEMQQLLQGPQVENPYGEPCDPVQAPEIITKTVASLPPEQMFELMKQMKLCIQNNPMEARQMLLLNPQLAYALLQAMVVMRIIDTQAALNMLFKSNNMPPVLGANHAQANSSANVGSSNGPQTNMSMPSMQTASPAQQPPAHVMNVPPSLMSSNFNVMQQQADIDLRGSGLDARSIDPRMSRGMDQDMRNIPNPVPPPNMDPRTQRLMGVSSMQAVSQVAPVPPPSLPQFPSDPRQRPMDPRLRNAVPPTNLSASAAAVASQQQTAAQRLASNAMGIPNDASDQEKAALIMQVLQLSDEQIAQLPPEQRTSILVLKEQIAKSTQR